AGDVSVVADDRVRGLRVACAARRSTGNNIIPPGSSCLFRSSATARIVMAPQLKREIARPEGIPIKRGRAGKALRLCFVLEINHRPVLVFSASSFQSAKARIHEPWFIEEMARIYAGGKPLMRSGDLRMVRPALPAEVAAIEVERSVEEARGEDVKYCFAFLV